MFERVPEIKEGEPLGTTHEYIKVDDTNSDLTTLIEQHENANPNSYYRGAFDLGTVEVAEKPDSLETRIETEATILGEDILDPVRLGKHRVKSKDVQSVLGGDIVETVVVDAKMAEVRGHPGEGVVSGKFKEPFLSSGIELQNARAKLKALCPFCPPPCGVFACGGKDR